MNCLVSHVNLGFREKGDAGEVKICSCESLCSDNVPEIACESIGFSHCLYTFLQADSLEAVFRFMYI